MTILRTTDIMITHSVCRFKRKKKHRCGIVFQSKILLFCNVGVTKYNQTLQQTKKSSEYKH